MRFLASGVTQQDVSKGYGEAADQVVRIVFVIVPHGEDEGGILGQTGEVCGANVEGQGVPPIRVTVVHHSAALDTIAVGSEVKLVWVGPVLVVVACQLQTGRIRGHDQVGVRLASEHLQVHVLQLATLQIGDSDDQHTHVDVVCGRS